jgi:colanic acid biosynthesis glycosyl transferase WcaI
MKILIYGINFSPELTGIGKYTGEMAEWLASKGHAVRVICAPPYYPEWRVAEAYQGRNYFNERLNGVDVYRCPLYVPKSPRAGSRLLHLLSFSLSSAPVLLKQLFFKPDVVMVVQPTFFCVPSALLFCKLSGAKSILHIQDFELDAMLGLGMAKHGWLSKFLYAIESALMRQMDMVSSISDSMSVKAQEKSRYSVPAHVFPNWVDIDFINPWVQTELYHLQWAIPNQAQVVLYSGNLGKKQGLEMLIKAAHLLSEQNIVFFIFGDGVERQALIDYANLLDLRNVRFEPLQPYKDLPALMLLADVHVVMQKRGVADLVMPSKLTTILSAGGHALITAEPDTELGSLCSKYPGIAECVEPENLDQFLTALSRMLLATKNGKPKINMVARDYAMTKLNKQIVLEQFEAILQDLSGERVAIKPFSA